jgi:ABC-type spermidine/putrescine transport system permease subunit II
MTDRSRPLLDAWAGLVYVFLFLPIVAVVGYSFNTGRALEVWDGAGTGAYSAIVDDDAVQAAIRTSMVAALGSASIATVLGLFAGVALARHPGRWRVAFVALLAAVLVTPEIVTAIALLIWDVRIGASVPLLADGMVRLWVGHSLFSTAVVTLIVRARMAGIDGSLEEAAADLYAPPARRFREITVPLVLPAVVAGLLLSFSLSLDDTIISAFVNVAGSTPWPVYVFSAVRSVLRPEIAAVSTVMLLVTLLAVGAVGWVLKSGGASGGDVARTMAGG